MCRLFALHADQPVTADFWLLDAPYSLRSQSRFNADGTGIGYVDEHGESVVRKHPIAAYESERFVHATESVCATTMIAHVRLSSGTHHTRENTHPFLQHDIITAHNGVLQVTSALKQRVKDLGTAPLLHGTTDSEWLAALVTGEVAARGDDLRDGVVAAVSWIARNAPVYSVNVLVARGDEVIALRLPSTNELWVLDRRTAASGTSARRGALEQNSATLHAHSDDIENVDAVVIASEPMDDDPAWSLLDSGEMLHVTGDQVRSERPFPLLARPLSIDDLGLSAAASQMHAAQDRAHQERRQRLAAAGA